MNLTKWLDSKGLTQRELSRKLGYSSNGPLSAVVRGDSPVPSDKVPAWADAIGLEGEERQQFINECGEECIPKWCWDRLRKAELEAADLRSQLRDLAADVGKIKVKRIKSSKKSR